MGWWFGFGPFAPLPTRGLLPPSDACFCLWAKLSSSGCAAPGAGLAVVEKFPTRPLARQGRHCLPFWGFAVPSSLPCRAGTRACHSPSWTVVSGLTPRVGCSCATAHANDGRHRACNLVVLWLRESRSFLVVGVRCAATAQGFGEETETGLALRLVFTPTMGLVGRDRCGCVWGFSSVVFHRGLLLGGSRVRWVRQLGWFRPLGAGAETVVAARPGAPPRPPRPADLGG